MTLFRWGIMYGIPIAWVAGSLAVLWFAWPVLSRFRDISKLATNRAIQRPSTKTLLAARLAQRDFRTRRLIALVPCVFATIGIIVLIPLPMPAIRIVTTVLFFMVLWMIGYKFYAENRDYAWEERQIERDDAEVV